MERGNAKAPITSPVSCGFPSYSTPPATSTGDSNLTLQMPSAAKFKQTLCSQRTRPPSHSTPVLQYLLRGLRGDGAPTLQQSYQENHRSTNDSIPMTRSGMVLCNMSQEELPPAPNTHGKLSSNACHNRSQRRTIVARHSRRDRYLVGDCNWPRKDYLGRKAVFGASTILDATRPHTHRSRLGSWMACEVPRHSVNHAMSPDRQCLITR